MKFDSKKILLSVLGIGVVSFVAYQLYKGASKKGNTSENGGGDGNGGGSDDIIVIDDGEDVGNLNDANALRNMANDLFSAMDGCGTDNQKIFDTLNKVKSEQDWQNLIRVYGTRTLDGSWFCGSLDFTGGLIDSIRDEMGGLFDTQIPKCNEILRSKGVRTLI